MSIKRIESAKRKKNYRYDSKLGLWIAYQADVTANGKRHRPKFPTKAEAEKYIDQVRLQYAYSITGINAPAKRSVRISQLFEKRLRSIKNPKEYTNAETAFHHFRRIIEIDAFVADIRKAHFQLYINDRLANVMPITVQRELTRLSAAFGQAEQLFPIDLEGYEPPKIPRPKAKKRGIENRRTISEAEKDAIVASILSQRLPNERPERTKTRRVYAAMFESAWMLGFRYSEILGCLKTNFNSKAGSLIFQREKTGTLTQLEFLPERIIEIFLEMSELSDTDRIFDLSASETTVIDILREACKANGIRYGQNLPDGITFHSTRHSFTTRLVQVTDIATAAAFTGHSDKEMVAYYSHASAASKRAAMRAMYGTKKDREEVLDLFRSVKDGAITFEDFYRLVLQRNNADKLALSASS